ncbi:rod shape-determining protein [Paucidesulfovibrio longus]|uniref:rod shape-determining protein n=1 Tax=Paucidesulfovibrio longus TaxID=889 RepID=UPI0003B6FC25|nr:rod shape-determining protein [Paucidesulfovibrio longus]
MIRKLSALFGGQSLAMDLGTANILLAAPGKGIVANEPSVIAIDTYTDKIICVGREAKAYIGRTPERIQVLRPIRNGVIAHYDAARQMIAHFVRDTSRKMNIFKPRLVICVPMGVTPVEKRAVIEAGMEGGARQVDLIIEPLAAAIGAGLPIREPLGNMVLDIGGGTSEVAVISLSSIAFAESVRVAGDAMNVAIQRYFQDKKQLLIGETIADKVKIEVGAAIALSEPRTMQVYGKNLVDGAPSSVVATDSDVRKAIREPLGAIVEAVRNALERTSPSLSADIYDNGLLLAGGGSMLAGLDDLISRDCGIKVRRDADPLTTVVRGTAKVLEKNADLDHVLLDR